MEAFPPLPRAQPRTHDLSEALPPGEIELEPELDGMVMLALKSQKERGFLLKLESHIINNLQTATIERIKLTTPMAPKLRKLVHMVSDYFGLHRIIDKEEGDEKKATMTLLKTAQTRIPARSLSVICGELDGEVQERQAFQLQRKVETGAEGEAKVEEPPPKPTWADVAKTEPPTKQPVPLAAGPLPGNMPLRRLPPPDEGGEDSSPLEVSPTDMEDDDSLSDDEAEDEESDGELVSRPPALTPGTIKVMQRRQADEEIPKSSGDESDSKVDPSRLPLEERERYYMEARARIFGGLKPPEAEVLPAEEAGPEDPQTVQRRAALEMKLAQERINDLKDPAYSRAIYPRFGYAMKGKGKGQLQGFIAGFQAAPTDQQGADPSQAPLAARAAVLEGQAPGWRSQQQPQQQPVAPQQPQQALQQQALQQQAMQQQALQQQAAMQQQQAQQAALQQQQAMQQQAMQQAAMQQQVLQQQAMLQQLLLQQQTMQQQAMQQQAMQGGMQPMLQEPGNQRPPGAQQPSGQRAQGPDLSLL